MLSTILPPVIIVIVPNTAIKKPTPAAVPIDLLISYPKVLIKGTINEPPPIPSNTDMKPIIIPEIFLADSEIIFGFFKSCSLKKIKNKPTIKAIIEKNKTKAGVFKFTAKNISGVIIGFISVLLGIGGGSLMVPFMRTFGYDIRRSIGTAAGVGFLIAVFGTITMITGGKIVDNINTPYSLGYVNLLGFLVFVPVTMIMARVGAKAVYKIDKNILSKIFGIFLIIVSIRSFFEYLSIN